MRVLTLLAVFMLTVACFGCGDGPTPSAEEQPPAPTARLEGSIPQAAATPQAGTTPQAGSTPEDVIHRYIDAQRRADNAALKALIHPETSPIRVKKPVEIPNYRIQSQRVLTAAEAMELTQPPPRLAGDVEVKVWEEYAGGRTSRNDYFVREFPEGWKVVAIKIEM